MNASVGPSAIWPHLKRDLIAILRGIKPSEAESIGEALIKAGITAIEVPLNSPDPFNSITQLVNAFPGVLIGAGTVLTAKDADRLNDAGGTLMISPNIDADVMARARAHKFVSMPGVFTATEALLALRLGATGLKFFPASALGPDGIKALSAILPKDCRIGAVGGVSDVDFKAYGKIGVRTFGLGSSLYKPGMEAEEVKKRAAKAVSAWDDIFVGQSV
jgi:2-dehydro-3-deoxyphosphogalactonate aldolase